jgi:hypothetical protein
MICPPRNPWKKSDQSFECFSETIRAPAAQMYHLPDLFSAFSLARLIQLIGKHFVFFLVMLAVRDPMFQPDFGFFHKIHCAILLMIFIPQAPWNHKV